MTKKDAITLIKEMNLPIPVCNELVEIIADLNYESYMNGYCQGYDDGAGQAMHEYW